MKNRYVPELVKSFAADRNWAELSGGQHHTIALDEAGNDGFIGDLPPILTHTYTCRVLARNGKTGRANCP